MQPTTHTCFPTNSKKWKLKNVLCEKWENELNSSLFPNENSPMAAHRPWTRTRLFWARSSEPGTHENRIATVSTEGCRELMGCRAHPEIINWRRGENEWSPTHRLRALNLVRCASGQFSKVLSRFPHLCQEESNTGRCTKTSMRKKNEEKWKKWKTPVGQSWVQNVIMW